MPMTNAKGDKAMPTSESQLRANKKYHEKFDLLQIRVPQGEKKAIQQHAAQNGESLNGFVRRAVNEAIERDNNR